MPVLTGLIAGAGVVMILGGTRGLIPVIRHRCRRVRARRERSREIEELVYGSSSRES